MSTTVPTFAMLGLSKSILSTISALGYEIPTPIQAKSIPLLLAGNDVVGQAQTGTGKTAAFALPLLNNVDLSSNAVQGLILAPTRELAIQVAEALQSYARNIKGFHVTAIYGGQSYETQFRQLKRGVHIVVGTPGRVMDHIRRGTLKLNQLTTLVLDEADEMLRMGFIDDVKWVLDQLPEKRQIALFSATMPAVIRKIAQTYLDNPKEVSIQDKTATAKTIKQYYWQVGGRHKLDALTRILESQDFDAILIFVRTKVATQELAEKLAARGHASFALNGDMQQRQREATIDQLRKGKLDIVVATDVAARGLDVDRITHVINYDIPHDVESYIHRIGRTGRAGKSGQAILFVTAREQRLLKSIERTTKQSIERLKMPSTGDINQQRLDRFKQKITQVMSSQNLDVFTRLVTEYQQEHDADPIKTAAALACMAQGEEPLLLEEIQSGSKDNQVYKSQSRQTRSGGRDGDKNAKHNQLSSKALALKNHPDIKMRRYKINAGYKHDVKPGNIVGAIANEADMESQYIGHIEIFDDFSTVDLPEGMPKEVFAALRNTRVAGRKIELELLDAKPKKRSVATINSKIKNKSSLKLSARQNAPSKLKKAKSRGSKSTS